MNSTRSPHGILPAAVVSAAVLASACENAVPLTPPAALISAEVASAHGATYEVIGDCSQAIIVDEGSVLEVDGMRTQRGAIVECPLTGDIAGTARLHLNLTLRNVGTPQVEGRVFGKSTFVVTSFLGRTDLTGTFEGPFNGSLAEVRFGQAKITRHGTGDFQGLVLHGVAVQEPPGSGREEESGRIVGRDLEP